MNQASLDLLKSKSSQELTPFKGFLEWSVKIGRVIIVVTELIVLAVFFARFKLDRDLLDLSNSMEAKLAVLATTEDFEEDFRNVQDRLEIIRGIYEGKTILSGMVKEINDRLPQEINFDDLAVEKNKINFSAKAPSGTAFAKLIQELKKIANVKEIVLGSSRFDPKTHQYFFSISIEPLE